MKVRTRLVIFRNKEREGDSYGRSAKPLALGKKQIKKRINIPVSS